MVQHQGQHPPEARKKEGEGEKGGAGEGEPSGRGKSLPWRGTAFAPHQKNFNWSCNSEATLEKAL